MQYNYPLKHCIKKENKWNPYPHKPNPLKYLHSHLLNTHGRWFKYPRARRFSKPTYPHHYILTRHTRIYFSYLAYSAFRRRLTRHQITWPPPRVSFSSPWRRDLSTYVSIGASAVDWLSLSSPRARGQARTHRHPQHPEPRRQRPGDDQSCRYTYSWAQRSTAASKMGSEYPHYYHPSALFYRAPICAVASTAVFNLLHPRRLHTPLDILLLFR